MSIGQYRSISSGLNPVREGFYIAERIVTAPFRFAYELGTDYVFLVRTRKENKELKRQLDLLRFKCEAVRGLETENARLRAMLDYKTARPELDLVPARLVAHDITTVFKTVVIDRGRSSGLRVDAPVVAPEGLVGRITATTLHTSQVLLITDPTSAVPAMIEETGVKGIVKGTGTNLLSMEYVRSNESVSVGNTVLTSGLGGRFPAGLTIGKVAEVEKTGRKIFLRIMVKPSVAMSRIDVIFGVNVHAEASR